MPGFTEDMAEFDEEFKEAEAATGPVVFSDGAHQAVVTTARVEEGQFGWQWVLGFRGIDTNTNAPASIRKWTNLPPEEGREKYLAGDLQTLGYDYKARGLSQLEQACIDEEFIGLVCTIGVKTKPGTERDYTNVYINGTTGEKVNVEEYLAGIGAGGGGDFSAAGDDGDDSDSDDIPF